MPQPLSLSDDEYATVMRAAGPIHPNERDLFLQALAEEIARHPVTGAGLIHRLASDLQRRFVVQARSDAETHRGEAHRGPRQGGRQAATDRLPAPEAVAGSKAALGPP